LGIETLLERSRGAVPTDVYMVRLATEQGVQARKVVVAGGQVHEGLELVEPGSGLGLLR
jgi:hypothetical protein